MPLSGQNPGRLLVGAREILSEALECWAGLQRSCARNLKRRPIQRSSSAFRGFLRLDRQLVGYVTAGVGDSRNCGLSPETAAGVAKAAPLGRTATGSVAPSGMQIEGSSWDTARSVHHRGWEKCK